MRTAPPNARTRTARALRRIGRFVAGSSTPLSLAALIACGGGGGGGTTTPPSNDPARVTLSVTQATTLQSGNTLTVSASVFTADDRPLPTVSVTWNTSDATIASVSGGLITASRVGTATITASAGAATSQGLAVTVTPGAPSQLGVRTQPGGAAVALPFTTQPVVEIRDAAGNVVTTSTGAVTAAVATGGGTLSGTTTISAISGVASFANLSLSGTVGNRTLTFSSTGLTATTSAPLPLAPGNPAQLAIRTQPVGGALGAPLLVAPVVELRDVAGNVAAGSNAEVNAFLAPGGGTIVSGGVVNAVAGVATFNNLLIAGTIGDRTLGFSVTGLTPVTSGSFNLAAIVYGTPAQKIQILDVNGAATPALSSGSPPTFLSRSPSRATVDNTGRITARAEGQAWLVSSVAAGSDSVLAIIPRAAGGPILRTDLTTYSVRAGTPVTVNLVLDPRSTPVGATSVFVTAFFENRDFQGTVTAVQPSGAVVVLNQPTVDVFRFSIASGAGITAPVTFGRLEFQAAPIGETIFINVTAIDAFAPDGNNLMPRTTSTIYSVSFR